LQDREEEGQALCHQQEEPAVQAAARLIGDKLKKEK
jgi:hypothetical protein